ncbi:MAG TPA: Crp/Fnr family transcriptional regulator [Rubrobacter sp.]
MGQNLFTPRYTHNMLFVVLEGRVRIYEVTGGREFTFMVIGAGEFFGELAFGNGQGLGTYAQALETSRICIVRQASFERLVMRWPEVGLIMMRLLNDRLVQFGNRMLDVGLKEVLPRLAGLIIFLADSEGVVNSGHTRIPTRYTHQQLGTMIGANREAVTNALISLRASGAITIVHRHIHVTDVQALKKIAGD